MSRPSISVMNWGNPFNARLVRAPVVPVAPMLGQILEVGHRHPRLHPSPGSCAGPPGAGQPVAQVVQVRLGDVDTERLDLCGHGSTLEVDIGQHLSYIAGILDVMNDTPARLLRLLSLLQTPREWPGSELAERLQVSARTIRRDVDRLRDLGYPVPPRGARPAATGSSRATPCPRCCSTTRRPWPSRSACEPPPGRRSTAWRKPPYGHWRNWSRYSPPGCATGSAHSTPPPIPMHHWVDRPVSTPST